MTPTLDLSPLRLADKAYRIPQRQKPPPLWQYLLGFAIAIFVVFLILASAFSTSIQRRAYDCSRQHAAGPVRPASPAGR